MPFQFANVDGRASLVHDQSYFDLERVTNGDFTSNPMDAIGRYQELGAVSLGLEASDADGVLSPSSLGPPVPAPQKVFGVGLNYKAHVEETGSDLPEFPVVFTKYPTCLNSAFGEVELRCDTGDYEAELVVVIGSHARDVEAANVWDHIAGFTCGQDISDRQLQRAARPPQFALGKSRDTYGPLGPTIVSLDSFADPTDLAISCDINGERRQDSRTSQMIFDIPFLVSYLSTILTLTPGDLIFTGTPAGVAAPTGNFLRPGDEIRTEIEGVGVMVNRCR